MKPERWRRIEEIFNSAIDLEPAQREIFLGKACAGDDALRKEVDRLLGGEKGAKGFIESPAIEVAARVLSEERKGGSAAGADTIPSTTEQPCTGRSIRSSSGRWRSS